MNIYFEYDDGGRASAGYKGEAGDCACRAIAIAARIPYADAYELVNRFGAMERRAKKCKSSARTGVYRPTMRKIMKTLGFEWVPTMGIGTGCTTHLSHKELPAGRIICSVSKHYTAVIDGVIHDTHDPSRDGTRCVYGFWMAPETGRITITTKAARKCVWGGDVRQAGASGYPWTAERDSDGKRRAVCPGCGRRLVVRSHPAAPMHDMLPRHNAA